MASSDPKEQSKDLADWIPFQLFQQGKALHLPTLTKQKSPADISTADASDLCDWHRSSLERRLLLQTVGSNLADASVKFLIYGACYKSVLGEGWGATHYYQAAEA